MVSRREHFNTTATNIGKAAEALGDIGEAMDRMSAIAGAYPDDQLPESMLEAMDQMVAHAEHALGIISPTDLLIFSNN